VTEKSNLLLDYVGKFINQTGAKANPSVKLTKSRSIISNGSRDCVVAIDVDDCLPLINYLDKIRQHLLDLAHIFDSFTNIFVQSMKNCDIVVNKFRCRRATVSFVITV
jgi:hypothetical protein